MASHIEYGPPKLKNAHFEGTEELEPGSLLVRVDVDSRDYKNEVWFCLSFARWTKRSILLELRDSLSFTRGTPAVKVIERLRALADRLEDSCVREVGHEVKITDKEALKEIEFTLYPSPIFIKPGQAQYPEPLDPLVEAQRKMKKIEDIIRKSKGQNKNPGGK